MDEVNIIRLFDCLFEEYMIYFQIQGDFFIWCALMDGVIFTEFNSGRWGRIDKFVGDECEIIHVGSTYTSGVSMME